MDNEQQPPCFDPPKGGWFRGRYISRESIQDMLDWCNPSDEYVEMLRAELDGEKERVQEV
jgi:hypothetical protein